MPKMKTRKSVAKRFKRTAGGKFRRTAAGRRHLLSGKSRKRKRQLRRGGLVSPADYRRIAQALAVH
ncbi:MAG: 50S ribosomal protein L35 [Kiritimatiellae bacterium]|nr:50S ribosomal protein L35 [Kiritimatiellia bacterium]